MGQSSFLKCLLCVLSHPSLIINPTALVKVTRVDLQRSDLELELRSGWKPGSSKEWLEVWPLHFTHPDSEVLLLASSVGPSRKDPDDLVVIHLYCMFKDFERLGEKESQQPKVKQREGRQRGGLRFICPRQQLEQQTRLCFIQELLRPPRHSQLVGQIRLPPQQNLPADAPSTLHAHVRCRSVPSPTVSFPTSYNN